MRYIIKPGSLSGTIKIPSSKSHTHRALIFALLANGTSRIDHYLDSSDSEIMITTIQKFGAKVKKSKEFIEVEGVGSNLKSPHDVIHAENSGIVLRFIGALAMLVPSYTVITGDRSIRTRRPVKSLLRALKQLGVFAESMAGNDFAPVIIKGPPTNGKCSLDGEDSQPISALLIATAFAKEKTEIYVTNPGEKPWIDLTLSWLDFFRIPYENNHYTHYKIPGGACISGFNYTVPGDFSSLAFPVVAALITRSEISIENVDMDDIQGDKKLLDFLKEMGAQLVVEGKILHVKKSDPLQGKTFDINDTIDAITILAVIGCFAKGKTVLTNASIARKKECDRIHCIATELKKMGADIEKKEKGLIISYSKLKGATLESYQDHRMAMSLTVAALGAKGVSVIKGVQCMKKTYPDFKKDLNQLGVEVQ